MATLAFGNIPYFALSERINRAYCDIHGYEFRLIRASDENERARVWFKVNGVAALLRCCDFVLFLDADAYFIDFSRSLLPLIELMGDAAVLFGTDRRDKTFAWSDRNANTGVFMIRNNEMAFRVLDEWWNAPYRYDRRWLWTWPPEQGAMNYIVRPLFPQSVIKVIPYFNMNGRDGVFIRHLIGMSNEERLEILTQEAGRLA